MGRVILASGQGFERAVRTSNTKVQRTQEKRMNLIFAEVAIPVHELVGIHRLGHVGHEGVSPVHACGRGVMLHSTAGSSGGECLV